MPSLHKSHQKYKKLNDQRKFLTRTNPNLTHKIQKIKSTNPHTNKPSYPTNLTKSYQTHVELLEQTQILDKKQSQQQPNFTQLSAWKFDKFTHITKICMLKNLIRRVTTKTLKSAKHRCTRVQKHEHKWNRYEQKSQKDMQSHL